MRFQNGRARAVYSVQHSPRLCHVELAGSGLWRLSSTMTKISYGGYRFAPEIIQQAIWLYLRFTLSFRDVEDWLAERGIVVSYETVRQWVNHFGPMIAADLGRRRPKPRRKFASTTTFGRSRVKSRLTLVFAARHELHNEAVVLRNFLMRQRDRINRPKT